MEDNKDNMELTSNMSREEIDIALKKFREMVKEMKETGNKPVNEENLVEVEIEEQEEVLTDTGNKPVEEQEEIEVKPNNKGKKTKRLTLILVCLILLVVLSFIFLGGLKKVNKKLVKYTITYDTNGGSYVYKEKVSYNEKIKEPIEPTKIGYEFDGWYLDDKLYDFNKPITKDIKLVAHWKKYESKPVSGVRLDQEDTIIQINTELSLIAYVEPTTAEDTTVIWSSSNERVATVDEHGLVKALSEGNTVITVQTKEGGYKATCNIKVAKKIINVTSIKLNKTTGSVSVGKTTNLEVTILPSNANNKGVIWESSDTSIATVIDGKVTGVSEGTVTIIARSKDGNYEAKAIIDVIDVPLTGLKVIGSKSVGIGEKIKLEASYSPVNTTHRNVIWVSSDKNILDVDSKGIVTGKSKGRATVTLKSEDGKYSDIYEIEVTNNRQVYNITLDKKSLALSIGESASLTATIYPVNAIDKKIIWSSSDENIVKVVNGKIKAIGEGSAIIKAVTNDGGYQTICNIIVSKKEPVYTVTITKDVLNTFTVLKDGVRFTDYTVILYNNIPLKEGNNINSMDIDESIKNIKIKIDSETIVDANVLYN